MSDLKQCPKCQNIQLKESRFCGQCGVDLSEVKSLDVFTPLDAGGEARINRNENAAYEYHVAGARLFRLLHTIIVISIVVNVALVIFVCLVSLSGVGLFSSFLRL